MYSAEKEGKANTKEANFATTDVLSEVHRMKLPKVDAMSDETNQNNRVGQTDKLNEDKSEKSQIENVA